MARRLFPALSIYRLSGWFGTCPRHSERPMSLCGGGTLRALQRYSSAALHHVGWSAYAEDMASIFLWINQQNQPWYFSCSSFFIQSLPEIVPRHFGLPHLHSMT